MRKLVGILAGLSLIAAACTTDGSGGTTSPRRVTGDFDPATLTFSARLTPFDACDGVLAHFKAEALERVGPYGLNGQVYFPWAIAETADGADRSAGAITTAAATSEFFGDDQGFSGTNVQVFGVDEPDIVKTDGQRIVSVVDGVLRLFDVSSGAPIMTDSLRLESGWGHRFLVDGDRAFVFSSGDIWGIPMFAEDAARIAPSGWGMPVSVIQEIDLSDRENLRVVRTVRVDGSYLNARAIDGTVHMAVSSYPNDLPFVYPSNEAAEDIALEANRRIIEQSKIETWLPSYTTYDAEGRETGQGLLVECDRMHRPAEFAGFDTLSVTTMDLEGGLAVGSGTGVIAQGQTVYASQENLYVATNVWIPQDEIGSSELRDLEERYETAIHKFSIGTEGATYSASGSVDGHLLNQFSLDEFEGNLRVATTTGSPWGDENSVSQVVVLAENDGVLEQVGQVGDLGEGERIFSVRFIGETGYVVTFRQIDPLYVLDLRDPENPAVTGELKIPGYSSYLHPLGDGKLLGVGQDADDEGRVRGTKVSMFDVSDPANPRELSVWTMPNGSSDVEWDHLAFLSWAPDDIVVLPVSSWSDQFFGAVVLKTDDGLREFGRVVHQREDTNGPKTDCEVLDVDAEWVEPGMVALHCTEDDLGGYSGTVCEAIPAGDTDWIEDEFGVDLGDLAEGDRVELCWPDHGSQNPQIIRSIVIGDTLWTLSWRALQANALDDLETIETLWFG